MKNKYCPAKMALFMTAYYITNSIYQSYMSLYYTSIRFTSSQIGIINAFLAAASLAGQPLWGIVGDNISSRRRLISLLSLVSAVFAVTFRFTAQFFPLMLLAGGFAFFYTSIQPLGDSVILKRLNEEGQPFGPFRLCGCAAFAISGLVFGRIIDASGMHVFIPIFTAGMCAVTAVSALSLPKSSNHHTKNHKISIKRLLKQGEIIRLLVFMAPVQITMGYFYTFFSPHFMSLEGANGKYLGACYLISAVSEIPFLLMSDRLFNRFGAGKLMSSAVLSLAIRWIILALGRTAGVALFSQIFHGWGFIVMSVCMAKFISRTVPDELQSSGQMLLAIVSFGIARVAGNLGGGLLADAIGRQNVFFICTGICLTSLCIFAPGYLRRPPLNGQNNISYSR